MSGEFVYTRKYIILKNEYSNIQGLNPKGHGLLEVRENKGKLSINVERCQSDSYYNVYLLGEKGENVVETLLGKVITNDLGKGSVEILFNPKNVAGTNNSIGNFNSIILRRGEHILFVGSIKNDRGVLQKYFSNIKVEDYKAVEDEEVVEEEIIEENIEKLEVEKTETEESNELYSQDEEVMEDEQIESQIEEHVEDINFQENFTEEESEEVESSKYIHVENNDFISQMTNYILSILRFFPYVKPFKVELKGYDWWRIESDGVNIHRGFLPFYNYILNMYHTYSSMQDTATCQYLIQKYNNYLFGMYKVEGDVRYYIYGIPGRFTTLEHPFRGETGFNTWHESRDGLGYWLLYINPLTGKILYPINPMKPIY